MAGSAREGERKKEGIHVSRNMPMQLTKLFVAFNRNGNFDDLRRRGDRRER